MILLSDFTISNIKNNRFKKDVPELYALKHVVENNAGHENDIVFEHTLAVATHLEKIIKQSPSITTYLSQPCDTHSRKDILFLATILHDMAKPNTIVVKDGITSCVHHEAIGATMVKPILEKFDLSTKEKERVIQIIKDHGVLHDILASRTEKLDEVLQNFKTIYADIALELIIFSLADTQGTQLQKLNPNEYAYRTTLFKKLLTEYTK